MRSFLGASDMMAYLTMMAQRMVELHRVLKDTGSIYLHCDPTASHYLKLLMDAVFGPENWRNEIIWKRTSAHNSATRYGPNHDTILFYTKSRRYTWNQAFQKYDEGYINRFYRHEDEKGRYRLSDLTGAGVRHGDSGEPWRGVNPTDVGRHWAVPRAILMEFTDKDVKGLTSQQKLDLLDEMGLVNWPPNGKMPRHKRYLDESNSQMRVQSTWTDINPIGAQARERLGYPTQKPETLLERIISASSNEGDVVLDPFCGCGTAIAAAERLNRRWIGIDITHLAVTLIRHRLQDTFKGELKPYEIIGQPQDLESAQTLATDSEHDGRYQFEWWALGLVDARPAQGRKKGADSGIDGYINFFDDNSGKAKRIVVQVKSGHVNRGQIATLKGDMEREKGGNRPVHHPRNANSPNGSRSHIRRVLHPRTLPRRPLSPHPDTHHQGTAQQLQAGRISSSGPGSHLPPRPAPPPFRRSAVQLRLIKTGPTYAVEGCALTLTLSQREREFVGYCAVNPPSTAMASPVTSDAASEHSQVTDSAISSGVPSLPMGCRDGIAAS